MRIITVLFASDDKEEHKAFADFARAGGLPYKILYPDSVSKIDSIITNEKVDIIITDLRFQNGGFADWLFLWPMPFILLADYKDAGKIDEIIKDGACDFMIRDKERNFLRLLPIMIRKVINQRESMNTQNMHLQISERRYLDLVQALPDIVYTLDGDGYFTFVNDSIQNLGYKPMDLIGKHFSSIIDPVEVPKVSRKFVLRDFEGKKTGPDKAPKLFDERRTGDRKTQDLEVKLKPSDKPLPGLMKIGSVISYGEVSSVGFAPAGMDMGSAGSAGIIRDVTARKQTEKFIRDSLREKEILLKEIHHRVKNNLQIISSLLYLQSDYVSNPDDLRLFVDSQMQVQSMALVHEQLYQSERLSSIDMGVYLRALCDKLFDVYRISPLRIKLDFFVENVLFDIDTAIPVALLVNELVSNSFKHAFPGETAGVVKIWLKEEDGECRLAIEDDGVGLPGEFDFEKAETLGHQLVASLTSQLEGKIERMDGNGTGFVVSFPLRGAKESS